MEFQFGEGGEQVRLQFCPFVETCSIDISAAAIPQRCSPPTNIGTKYHPSTTVVPSQVGRKVVHAGPAAITVSLRSPFSTIKSLYIELGLLSLLQSPSFLVHDRIVTPFLTSPVNHL